jgi:hypothetical protein
MRVSFMDAVQLEARLKLQKEFETRQRERARQLAAIKAGIQMPTQQGARAPPSPEPPVPQTPQAPAPVRAFARMPLSPVHALAGRRRCWRRRDPRPGAAGRAEARHPAAAPPAVVRAGRARVLCRGGRLQGPQR